MKFSPAQEIKHLETMKALGLDMNSNHLNSIVIRTEHEAIQEGRDYWKQAKESLALFILDHKDNARFTENLPNSARGERLVSYMTMIDGMIVDLKDRGDFFTQLNEYADKLFSPEFPPCGNNADWSVRAWYVGIHTPLEEDGDRYILDHEDGTYSITKRDYIGDGETEQVDLITIDLNHARNVEEGREMLNLLGQSGTYIVHNL